MASWLAVARVGRVVPARWRLGAVVHNRSSRRTVSAAGHDLDEVATNPERDDGAQSPH